MRFSFQMHGTVPTPSCFERLGMRTGALYLVLSPSKGEGRLEMVCG